MGRSFLGIPVLTKTIKPSEDWCCQIQSAGLGKAPAHVQSLLSVQGGRAVHLFQQVPADMQIAPHKYSSAKKRRDMISGRREQAQTHRWTLQSGETSWSLRAWQTLKWMSQYSVLLLEILLP